MHCKKAILIRCTHLIDLLVILFFFFLFTNNNKNVVGVGVQCITFPGLCWHKFITQHDISPFYKAFIPMAERSCSKMMSWSVVVGAKRDQMGMKPRHSVRGPSLRQILTKQSAALL